MLTTLTIRGRQIQIGRAPKGGIDLGGKHYRGGQFIPVSALPIMGGAPENKAKPKPAGYRVYSGGRSCDRLSNRGYYRSGGKGSGSARWWIRGEHGFVTVPAVRGDDHFDEVMDLEPGDYTLGTGRGGDAIRKRFRITAGGELVWL